MIYNGKEIEFPAVTHISFFKVIEALEEIAKGKELGAADYAKQLIAEIEKYPELKNGFKDLGLIKKHKKIINRISRVLFPDALLTNEIKALTPPFFFYPIYTSTRFDNIVEASGEEFSYKMKDVDEDLFYLYCCYFILRNYYGYTIKGKGSLNVEIQNKIQQLTKTYKLGINADMSEFIPTDRAKDITRKDFEELIDNFGDIDLWKEKFPPNSWVIKGVNMINLVDVTIDQALTSITDNLLQKTDDSFGNIIEGMCRLLGNPKLKIGILTLDKTSKLIPIGNEEVKSLLLNPGEFIECNTEMCDYAYYQLFKRNEPLVLSDVDRFHKSSMSQVSKKLSDLGFKSYILIPLLYEEEVLGFMELASDTRYELNQVTVTVLEEVVPILAMTHKRFEAESKNRIEAIIQQECTTIHPSVKWRFELEAESFINKQLRNEQASFKDIVFSNLYPLYGQMDIKGSSMRRNKAVSADLNKQIESVKKILEYAYQFVKMPIYEELVFRLSTYSAELEKGLSASSEYKVLSFLKSEIYPLFEILSESDSYLKKLINDYNSLLDPHLNTIYNERKKYDESVNLINQKLASYLDKRQEEAQDMFPHYFERYKTDGVEYNMYIGQSITQEERFSSVYLKNLRIWQLLVMCEMENEFKQIQKELDTPIEIASLILVYNTSLSVHFRMDEKRFDVEGAYNARYEIIKKRVDKALIRGTDERITQPGKIAIIYSQEQDAVEYQKYLHFLSSKNFIKKGIEDLELEDLQGVTGLRALRVEVNYTIGLTVDEFIDSIENKVK